MTPLLSMYPGNQSLPAGPSRTRTTSKEERTSGLLVMMIELLGETRTINQHLVCPALVSGPDWLELRD